MKSWIQIVGNLIVCLALLSSGAQGQAESEPALSEASEACIDCHAAFHPGIVEGWQQSRHAIVTPATALRAEPLARKVSAEEIPGDLREVVVGCAECHMTNPEGHPDTFDHMGYAIHTVVTPKDCAVCHPTEASQFDENIMAWAHDNLMRNDLYLDLTTSILGTQKLEGAHMRTYPANDTTNADACLSCHGTKVGVTGIETRETVLGELDFPILTGWPNQGVGRINPDRSRGTCSAGHTRHQFSIEMARNPNACAKCHKGPDVPAYQVYSVSKHGAIFSAHGDEWDLQTVPWTIGEDFTAPTCATCHVSLLVNGDGEVVSERTHRMNDRLDTRIFGLIYAHPHPKNPKTFTIENEAGLPLPTELTGEPATNYLIDDQEAQTRRTRMKDICLSCHGHSWVDGHFARLDNTIETTNAMVFTATAIVQQAWLEQLAGDPSQRSSVFDEPIEKMWVEQWLFYANSTRFASAMAGADYGVFANGRWWLSKNIREMRQLLQSLRE
jgi:hypothetical protein